MARFAGKFGGFLNRRHVGKLHFHQRFPLPGARGQSSGCSGYGSADRRLKAAVGVPSQCTLSRLIVWSNLPPGIGDILQQLDHFDDRRFVIIQVGLHQASLHIIVQRRQIIGDFAALLVVEAAFQPVVDDVDCLRQRQAFTGDIP